MLRTWLLAMLLSLLASTLADAQGRFFWSDLGFGEGADAGDFLIDLTLGQSDELFLYYQTLDQDVSDGFYFEFSFDQTDRVWFMQAATFNFDVTVAGVPIGSRWDSAGSADVTNNSIEFFSAVSIDQFGILQSNNGMGAFLDEGYDPSSGAFLVGSISVTAVGSAVVQLQYDVVQVADQGQLIDPILSELFINSALNCKLTGQNDLWNNSTEITETDFPVTWGGSNGAATTEPGEQQLENTGSTVWFHLTAISDGLMTVDTLLSGFNTQLHIYTGAELGFENLIPVTHNNDVGGTEQSRVSFPVNGGQRYEIRVGGFHDGTGGGKVDEQGCILGHIDLLQHALAGDLNCDGRVNLLDVVPFIDSLINNIYNAKADLNYDGEVNLLDVNPFVELLGG